jgi:flavin-dependent dehydrogenase
VSGSRAFEVAVIGGGPAALVAARSLSRTSRTVLVMDRLPTLDQPGRIDAIPARTLALLVELGVRPQAIGVEKLHHERSLSWETSEPRTSLMSPTAHVERPRLEMALFETVLRDGAVEIVLDRAAPRWEDGFVGAGWSARHLVDATGRRAVTAGRIVRPPEPWGGRFFLTSRRGISADPTLRVAALDDGYAYRLGSADNIGLGFIGRDALMKASPDDLEANLRRTAAAWMLADLPPLAAMRIGSAGVGSIQWAVGGIGVRIADAVMCRDSLSSQGIAAACAEAVSIPTSGALDEEGTARARQAGEMTRHLAMLGGLLERSRFRDAPAWRAYASFVTGHRPSRRRRRHSAGTLEGGELRPASGTSDGQERLGSVRRQTS